MTEGLTPAGVAGPPARSVELVLARIHVRLGSLALARTELETLAELGKLDTAGFADLAEVRWRSGALAGAGAAAAASLRGDGEQPVALLIAAEAAAALGRPSEARRLALQAMACATGSIDAIFAGMPRSAAWPADADEPAPTAPTLFDRAPEAAGRDERIPSATIEAPSASTGAATGMGAASAAPTMTVGFWDEDVVADPGPTDVPDPALELVAGRAALVAGALDEAALRFGLALRLAPALAPAILEATAGARVPSLIIVRGDAHRLTGHEMEAREAYVVAARGGLPERRRRPRPRTAKRAVLITSAPDPTPPAGPDIADDAAEQEIPLQETVRMEAEAADHVAVDGDDPDRPAGPPGASSA